MADIKIYKTNDLVLRVKENFDPAKLKLKKWVDFIDVLCGDREYQKEAIRAALKSASPGDTVIITGKGAEPWMMLVNGQKLSWDDREVVREELQKI